LKFCDLGLHPFILQGNLFDSDDLFTIGVAVNVWSQSKVALHLAEAQTDNSFMKLILSKY
jgi:hypothetical protein